jgi:transposase InsO family protein
MSDKYAAMAAELRHFPVRMTCSALGMSESGFEDDFVTRTHARHAIFTFLQVWYNRERRHSSLGYVSPVRHE